jgi:hypothetical protein
MKKLMKNLFIVLLVVFGLPSVASAQDPDISLAYVSGSTGYLELYDNPTLGSVPSSWTALDMIDVGRLPNGNTIAAYTSGSSQYLELYDSAGSALNNINLNGLIAVSGLASGDLVAAYTSGSSDYVEIYDGTTLSAVGGAFTSFGAGEVIDVTGVQGGEVVIAYTSGSSDYAEHYDLTMTVLPSSWKSFTGLEHVAGMENGDVAMYYGAATNYLQFFNGYGWASGAWMQHNGIKDIAGLAGGDILIGYNSGSKDYMQAMDPTLTTWRTPFNSYTSSITALEGDYLPIPEPTSLGLMAMGSLLFRGVSFRRRRRLEK